MGMLPANETRSSSTTDKNDSAGFPEIRRFTKVEAFSPGMDIGLSPALAQAALRGDRLHERGSEASVELSLRIGLQLERCVCDRGPDVGCGFFASQNMPPGGSRGCVFEKIALFASLRPPAGGERVGLQRSRVWATSSCSRMASDGAGASPPGKAIAAAALLE